MARRIEIELTSARPDGSWTWRAAGARQPRGVLDGELLQAGAKAGDVLRAEAEFEIEGITIVSVLAPKETSRPEAQRIEILGSGRPDSPGVTTQLVGRTGRRPGSSERRGDRDDGRPRHERDDARPRRERDGRRTVSGPGTSRPRRDTPAADGEVTEAGAAGDGAQGQTDGRRGRPVRSESRNRRQRPAGSTDGRDEAGSSADRGDGPAPVRSERSGRRPAGRDGHGRDSRDGRDGRDGHRPDEAGRRPRRFNPGHAHRQAVMASLPPEQQPIAEQVLRGGIPAVRTALHLEREKAVAAGRPAPNTDQLIAMAESLLPRLKAAEWHDRAEAAAKDVDEISLRDLRSVVAAADAARDDETRALAATLRDALARRVEEMRQAWSEEIAKHLDDNRVVRALRLAARPPEPAGRLDPELTERLNDAAGQAMSPDTPSDRWLALLDAVAASPVRRSVKPVGLPSDPSPELRKAAHQQSGRIPALAAMLGVTIPPPPVATTSRRRGRPAHAAAPGAGDSETPEPSAARAGDEEPRRAEPHAAMADVDTPPPAAAEATTERDDVATTDALDLPEAQNDPVLVEELGEPLGER